jgi:hypothetical protein
MPLLMHHISFAGSSVNGIPLLFNAGLVSHYRRYLNPVDPRNLLVANGGGVAELNKSFCKGKKEEFLHFFLNTIIIKCLWAIYIIDNIIIIEPCDVRVKPIDP